MEWLRTIRNKYNEVIFGISRGVIDTTNISGISKLNDSVYEFYRPESGVSPDVEVVLFHGVYQGTSNKAYLETWTCFDGLTAHCWPKTWVAERFPRARILSVSYDSSIKKGPTQGRVDLYCVAENLIQDLTHGNVGVRDACPLILVGHGFGGIVIKAVCLEASDRRMEAFLCNVKGMLFYSTPQLGISNMPTEFDGALAKTLGWDNEEIARLNYKFQKVRKEKKWTTKAILAAYPGKEPQLDAKEASVRFDVDEFYTAQEDIDTICRPREDTSITVTYLTGFLSDCIASRFGPRSATKQGVKSTSSLLFENDEYYVPMKRSRNEVRNALNSPSVRIVVLHGLPGSGKSSLAKHLALLFADESNMDSQDQGTMGTSSDSGQQSCFTDGVVYLTCGKGANVISKQQELLLNFKVTPFVDNEVCLDGVGLQRKLGEHLKDLKVLIILDDIWESELLDKLVVPGRHIKYLVTTQVTTWSDYNIKNVPIQNVSQDDARKILGNYAGFQDGVIPEELTEVVDELIKATKSHPLALATLAMVVNCGYDFTSEKEWQEVKDNFFNCLTSEKRARGFGETYPKTVYSAMTFAVDLIDDDAKSLLYTIALFQGPEIPEHVVQLFHQCTRHERSWKKTYSSRKRLESLGLVRKMPVLSLYGYDSKQNHMAFVIHGLRQQFILCRMLDYLNVSITEFLVKDGRLLHQRERVECERDLATTLCSVFGGAIVQKVAIRNLGSQFIWSDSILLVQLNPLFSWLVSIMVVETQGAPDNQVHTAKAATEVFWMLFNKGEVDDDNMSFLLCGKTATPACALLSNLSIIFHGTQYALRVVAIPCSTNRLLNLLDYKEAIVQFHAIQTIRLLANTDENRGTIMKDFSSCLKRLVALLSPNVDERIQKETLKCLTNLASTHEDPVLMEILGTPSLLENVVMLLSEDVEGKCTQATTLICNLADAGLQATIVRFPLCLERLVALLAPDVDKGHAQKIALRALTSLASTREGLALTKILETPSLLENVVMLLSEDTEGKCMQAANLICNLASAGLETTIVRFPLCLERLVALLAPNVDEGAQKIALRALTMLASTHERPTLTEILGTPGLLENVVMLLSEDSEGKCTQATKLICNLAVAGLQSTIVRFPQCLEKLVTLLSPNVDNGTQKEALEALANLAHTHESSVLMEILGTPCLLERVVMLLSVDTEGRCMAAAGFICNLAQGGLQATIVRFPLCLERLVALLAPEMDEGAQQIALRALNNLASTHERPILTEILRTQGLLENVVMLLYKDTKGRCMEAAKLISNLASAGLQGNIARFPLCLERLVALLSPDVDKGAQKKALEALANLAGTDESHVLMKILGTPSLLERVVMLLSVDTEGRCMAAAGLICNLANVGLQTTIMRLPLCLERLVALLSPDVDKGAQKRALEALANLADTDESFILMEILGTPFLLERVVMLLSMDTEGRCAAAARLICNLAIGGLQATIVQFPFCLERLVALLAPDVDKVGQKEALGALANLAGTDESSVLMEIFRTPCLLARVVMLLSVDTESKCTVAAGLICNLAQNGLRDTIVRFPLCLERLAALLAPQVDEGTQKIALRALTNLASTHECLALTEILGTQGLLENVVMLLNEDSKGRCMQAMQLICNLANSGVQGTIVRFPLCLQRLVALLSPDVDNDVQKEALEALANLASTHESSVLMEILGTPCLFERVVMLLSVDMEDRCTAAVRLICKLAQEGVQSTIVQFPLCLERLVALLAPRVDEGTQKIVLRALTNLASTHECPALTDILETPGLLENVVMHLSVDTEGKCTEAVKFICKLASNRVLRPIIARFPLCVERLVDLLSPDVNEGTQQEALKALTTLADTHENPVLEEILEPF